MIVLSDRLTRVQLEEAADFLNYKCTFINTVELVLQLGSGCSVAGLLDEEWARFPLHHMPHMPQEPSTAKHELQVHWGTIGATKTLVFSGRYHLYEGYGRLPCLLPIWAAAYAGARSFVLTNAAGAVNPHMKPGDFMCMADHVNNLGISAIAGHQHLFDDPFVDMSNVYFKPWCRSFRVAGEAEGLTIHDGIYMANHGPEFETPAEIRMAQHMSIDAVGMSTVLEATLAHAAGARVMGISLITNMAAGMEGKTISHEEHLQVGRRTGSRLVNGIRRWVNDGGLAS